MELHLGPPSRDPAKGKAAKTMPTPQNKPDWRYPPSREASHAHLSRPVSLDSKVVRGDVVGRVALAYQ